MGCSPGDGRADAVGRADAGEGAWSRDDIS
jgi:hypothetical protein